ncbi:chemotaxis protein CheW [Rheinheimera sp. MMS21-TC3]|uniref:chemotaxis protein CheW n=1 Tax=Rheinheimera sp. MMS21-TC3 TaxID=3072790 RepID=UPI0028C4CE8C|nr:chemotaxis protein CheW [Rheinheimera sp. MMS21-TC3]WNO61774.1 chemotaxis protein CheW [Rheinheimera sp. MMS21-TC3]
MSNLNASHKVMQHYLSALLTEEKAEVDVLAKQQQQQLNSLLAQVSQNKPAVSKPKVAVKPKENIAAVAAVTLKKQTDTLLTETTQSTVTAEKEYRTGRFQALFFELAGLKVAVPLKELGGIHKLGRVNSLFAKPQWFKGVMLYREQKINIVDTACWVMPEKYDQQMQQQLNYQYVIMLGQSNWGICCESLVNTFVLEQEDVKWRQVEGKRPWMAGVIKEHMCVLLDVDVMIDLLNRGLDITA